MDETGGHLNLSAPRVSVFNATRLCYLSTSVRVADTFLTRLVGLLAEPPGWIHSGEGLWILPCRGVHTIGLRFAIDVVSLDRNSVVVGLKESLSPCSVTNPFLHSSSVLEFPPGTIARSNTKVGDKLDIGPAVGPA